jgi:hypothetical protein
MEASRPTELPPQANMARPLLVNTARLRPNSNMELLLPGIMGLRLPDSTARRHPSSTELLLQASMGHLLRLPPTTLTEPRLLSNMALRRRSNTVRRPRQRWDMAHHNTFNGMRCQMPKLCAAR